MKNLLTPLDLKRYSLKIYLLFGYGLPALFSATVTLTFSSKYEIFIREDSEGDILACFVSLSAMWIVALPACTLSFIYKPMNENFIKLFSVFVVAVNILATLIAVMVAHRRR